MTASLFLLASPQRATVQMHMNEQWPSLRQDVFHTLGLLLSGFLAEYQLFQIRAMSTTCPFRSYFLACLVRMLQMGERSPLSSGSPGGLSSPSEYFRFLHPVPNEIEKKFVLRFFALEMFVLVKSAHGHHYGRHYDDHEK